MLAYAKTVSYDFSVGYVTAAPDGFTRQVIGINGQWPIPTIECDEGDTVSVTVHNNLPDQTTSLHFHGIWQTGTQVYDGPSGVTQCPIQPGSSFTYTFIANPAGTHWYHSHEKGQYPDGLRGKMIVHDRAWEKSLGIDQQKYLSISDWYHRTMPEMIEDYMSPDNTQGLFDSPDSLLFNDTNKPFDLNLVKGKKYLLRIVNTAAVACAQFHIEGYKLTVVESDGVQTVPRDADTIILCAGQSYGVIVTGKTNPTGAANWIAQMQTDMLTRPAPPLAARTIIGKLVYSLTDIISSIVGDLIDNIVDSLSPSWTPSSVLDDMTLQPLDGQKLLSPVDNHIELTTNQTYFNGIGTRTPLNADPWVPPQVPSLYTALTTGSLDAATYGPGVNPWIVRSGQIVQIYMQNPHQYPHPMHLHGHVFQVVASGTGTWNGVESSLPRIPLKRDGHVVPAYGYSVFRFQANNPGVWFFHCHIDLHLVGGMAATIIEAPDLLNGGVPAKGVALCDAGGYKSSGNCAGGKGDLSAMEAREKCNNVFNTKVRGALIGSGHV
ncbi:Conidial Pigment Biosynthesis brown1 [Pyrenophora seminiperda CCB06]|uniref:Conidial Pigment Biosynthesis brown1 n=1 Tax=Pyrenophora seminiperda CCB06 TaxID=1302712 RepID=A0A3M7M1H4_9PLEO|nr:Conidial Pigment Biosynthesis brown1 [Pyrenophora seminiperda CCB06]